MEQHPVPQHIASFQFKLFGNLTVRQFVTLAIPLSLAGAIFFSGMAPIVRFPLTIIIGLCGFFVALVPVSGRPFDKWIVAFIRAILSPTQRVWIKEKRMPEFLNVVLTPPQLEEKVPQEITEQGRERLVAYLKSLPKENESPLDVREDVAISALNLSVDATGVGSMPPPIIWPSNIAGALGEQPEEGPRIQRQTDSISMPPKIGVQIGAKPEIIPVDLPKIVVANVGEVSKVDMPKIAVHSKPFTISGIEERLSKKEVRRDTLTYHAPMAHLASDTNFAIDNVISVMEPDNRVRLVRSVGKTRVRKLHFAPPANFDLSKLPIRGERRFEISDELKRRFKFEDESPDVVLASEASPVVSSIKVDNSGAMTEIARELPKTVKTAQKPQGVRQEKVIKPVEIAKRESPQPKFTISDKRQTEDQTQATSAQIIPLTNTPNVISGLIMDPTGVPLEGAVLVVRDAGGIPVRALKTNKLGQFLSATPLASGEYSLEIESETAAFKPTSLSLNGQVVPPLGIKGEVRTS